MKPRSVKLFLFCMACLLSCVTAGLADTALDESVSSSSIGKPRWEIGVCGVMGRLPEYPAAVDYETYVFPLPFFVYRGDVVQVDRDGARGIFWKPSWGEFDVSFFGNPPVRDSDARVGMPDLDPLLEVGPSLRIHVLPPNKPGPELYFQAALRGVVSIDMDNFEPAYQGLSSEFKLQLNGCRLGPASPWRFGGSIGIDFDDSRYTDYFYDVKEAEDIPHRPAYTSHGGYGGFSLAAYAARRLCHRATWGLYTRWDNFDGTSYEESPLVQSKNNIILGTAITWTLAESKEVVQKHP